MINNQLDNEIRKVKNLISKCEKDEKKYEDKVFESEEKLRKLTSSLDKVNNTFYKFDMLNRSFKELTENRFVISWVESRESINLSEKNDANKDMDASYNEQLKEQNSYRDKLEDCRILKNSLNKKLKILEERKKQETNLL